jgi:hypothetical protein
MSRIPDDYDPKLVNPDDDEGPPTKELKPLRPRSRPLRPRNPAAKTDLDRIEDVLDLPLPPRAPSS